MGKSRSHSRRAKRSRRARRARDSSSSSSSSTTDERHRKKMRKLEKKISKLTQQVSDSQNSKQVSSVRAVVDENIIPFFDPNANNLTAIEWIKKVDDLASYHGWDKIVTLKLATSRLRGNARKWYDTAQISGLDWDNVKLILQDNFPSVVKFGKLLVDAANYVPHSRQNLGDYCFEKVAKLNKLHLSIPDEFLIDSVLEGITDKNVALAARAANFQTVGELASYLSNISSLSSIENREKLVTKRKI